MNSSKKVTGRKTFIIPYSDLKTATVLQLIQRYSSEYELLIPFRMLTVVYNSCLVTIFASPIYGYYTAVRHTVNFSLFILP